MKLTVLLLKSPTQPHEVRRLGYGWERYETPPTVRPGSLVTLGGHGGPVVGAITSTWTGPDGTLYAEATVGREQEVRDALANSRAASIELETQPGHIADWTQHCEHVHPRGSEILGVAIGVREGARPDTRVVRVEAPAPKPAPTVEPRRAAPPPSHAPLEYVNFGPQRLTVTSGTPAVRHPVATGGIEHT